METEQKAKASGRSIASMVLSIASVVPCIGLLTCLLGLILGGLEMKAIKEGRSSPKGRGFALAGLIIGIVGLFIQFLYIAIPNYVHFGERGVKESIVKSVAHDLQLAVEDYKVQPGNAGLKPALVSEIDSFLPTQYRNKRNPLTKKQTYSLSGGGLVDGYPTQPGQVGYVFTDQRVPYKIIALGKDGEPILTLEEGQ